ncbi:adenylyl-sulfate kinase [Nocardioides convexus]|uniref:adenylyl-sulfate kinase n=1 Tax=Nocardioides convexus TaxID=2712224 RepID=UPI0024185B42|nr:adenylyl-sulfate kinase [Nocardioides convexus]
MLFFTGLSGSGKSTIARALMDRILEQGARTITSLDGDVVRRNLSAGLTFSKADRETNIRRIGWVAAEIARHGGVAICSPIAPFDETRQQVRAMVEQAGGRFFLVHVATPLEECERRDRKGLYAKARRGEIPEFTGISSPYEEPADADVRVDTTGRTIEDALDDVVAGLAESGLMFLRTTDPGSPPPAAAAATARRTAARREAARPRAADAGPLRVLFVCTANICRSPYMESAGPGACWAPTPTWSSPAPARTASARTRWTRRWRACSPTAASPTPWSPASPAAGSPASLIDEADLVLTAEAAHRAFVLEDAPGAFRKAFTLGQFAESVERVDANLTGAALVTAVGHRRAGAVDAHDVRDPYRRGRSAAEASADQIDALLRAVLPRLSPPETGSA